MRDRLTKAHAEAVMAAAEGSFEQLYDALADAVAVLHPGRDLLAVLEDRGRTELVAALRCGDSGAAWALATELNELRRLA